jgi:F-type H+-transporting ATPase subunit delta
MAEVVTIARPYAVAVYRLAKEKNTLPYWSEMLAFASAVVVDPQMSALIEDPNVSSRELEDIFLKICGNRLDAAGINLVKLLVEYGRLALLPMVASLFEELKAQDEGVVEAEITVASKLGETQLKSLISRLESRFKSRVEARMTVDPGVIGGIKIVVGDTVIDATVRAQLQEMAYALKG